MTDKLVFEADLDNTPILKAFERVRTEALAIDRLMSDLGKGTDLQQAMAQLATAATSSMQVVRQQLKTIDTSVKELQSQISTSGKAAGKALGDSVAAGVQESTGKVTSVVRAQVQWLQASYEDAIKKGVKFSIKDLTDFRAWGVNIGPDAKARLRDQAQQAVAEVAKVTKAAQAEIAGHYDALGNFISTASVKATTAADVANRRMLLLSPAEVSTATTQAKAAIAGHYDALGNFIPQAAAGAAAAANLANRRALLLDTGEVRAATAQSKAEVAVHYDALGRVINTEAARVSASAEAANRRMLMLDTGTVRAATAQAQREIKVHYDSLGRVINEGAAQMAASADAANKRALMLDTGVVRAATAQAQREIKVHYDSLGRVINEGAAKAAASSDAVSKRALTLDKATKDLTKSQTDLNDAFRSGHSAARGLASGMNMMWLTWGQLGPLLAGAALSNAFVQAIKLGSQFENTLAIIEHVGGQASEEVRQLGEAALNLSRVGPYGPNEVALALKTMALAGLDAQESLSALKPMLDFALVGEMSVEKATESALAISKAFGYTAEGVSSVTDVIAKAAAVSMSSIGSMTEAFRQASTVAQQFGVSLKDASTTLALLSQVGIQGTAAGTAMRNMYTELLGMSKGARDILKNVLKVEVFDNAAKAMKPLAEILRDLSASLKGLDFESQLRVLQKLGNERGLKALSADLVAFVTAAKGSGKDVVTVFEQIRKAMEDSAGFVAVAAVNMSLTTSNQLKSVGSALQTTLVEAFLSVNTEVQRTAGALRDAFNSKEFKEGVAGLVGSLATLVRFLLDHKDVLAAIGIGVVGGVAATAGFAMFSSLSAAIGAAAAAAGVAAPALSLLLAALGPVGAVLGVATAAYILFGRTAKTESQRAAEAAGTQYAATMEGIKAEQERLDKAIAATKAQLLGTDSVLKVEQENAIERTRILHSEQMEVERTRHQHVLLNAQRTLSKIQGTEYENTAQGAAAVRQANEQIAASSAHVNETWKRQERQMGALVAGMAGVRRGAAELANLQEQLAKKNSNKPTGPGAYDPDAASKHAAALKGVRDNELAQVEKFYASQLSLLDKYNSNAQTRLKDALSAGLIEKGEFMAREIQLTEGFETQKLALLDKERAAYEAAYQDGVLKQLKNYDDWVQKSKNEKGFAERQVREFEALQQSLVNASRAAETFFEKNDNEKAKVQDSALTRLNKQAVELSGSIKKLATDTREFWAAEDVLSKKAATQTGVEDSLRYASPQAAAYISAAAKETEHLTDRVYDYDKQIRLAKISMDAFVASVGDDVNWTESLTASYLGQKEALAALNAERSKLLSVIPDRAAEKGKLAVDKYWKDWEADLVKGLTGVVMVGLFDGGKSGAKALRALIIAELKRPIQVVVQALVQPVVGALSAAMGVSGTAQAAGSVGNVGSLVGLAGSMGSFGSGFASGLTAWGAEGSVTGLLSSGLDLFAGGIANGLGAIAGALGPIALGIGAVYALAKNLDHSGTPHTGAGTSYSAAGGLQQASSGAIFNSGFTGIDYSAGTEEFTTNIVKSVVQILDTTATTFGKTAGYQAAASFADDSSKDGAWGSLFIRNMDKVLTDWQAGGQSFRTFSDGTAGNNEFLAAVSQDVRAALDGIELPDWADKMMDKLGDAPGLDQLASVVSEINATQVVLQSLGASVKVFAGLSGDAVLNIISASGGLQTFSANLTAYYDAFYSDKEKFDAKLQTLNTSLQNLAAGGAFADSSAEFYRAITEPTRENFRKLVEAQDLTTASGQTTYAALLGLSGVVAELTPVTEKAAEAVQTLGTAAMTLADVQKLFDSNAKTILNAAQYTAYRIQQIQATLSAAGMELSAQQISSLTREQVLAGYQQAMAAGNVEAAGAILNVVDALTEVSAGFQGVTVESTSAAAAVQKVVTTLADVQTQFSSAARTLLNDTQYTAYQVAQIQATLGSVGINVTAADIMGATKAQVLAGLSEMMAAGNLDAARAILSVVDALSQVSSGFQTVAATASNAAAVMQQRAGLESTLLNLTGNTAGIRARELASLDASNRGLQEHIYAIQDAQQAIQDAQQAVNDATSAYSAQESAISNLQSAAQRWIATMGTASGLLDQISGALGGAGGNREAALWATVNGDGDIDARLSAAQELFSLITQTAAVERTAQDNALSNAKALLDYGHRLRDYVQGLKTGDLSTLTPAQKVAEALAQYQTTLAAAQGGDQTALGNLQGVADTYLRLAREFDPASYTTSVFTSVTSALDSLGVGLINQNEPQVALLQAQLDATNAASSSANALSADQIARLQTLQTVVQDLYAQAGAQSAIANAQVSSAQANLQALGAAQLAAQQTLALRQQALVDAQAAATAYMATLVDVVVADPVPEILRGLPEGIAAALAPLLNANPASTAAAAAATTAQRAQIIRDYAATLPQDDTGARMLYDAAVANGVSSSELDAAMGFAAGSSLAWAVSHGLPAFAQGTNYVPRDMLAQIHKGEAIIPARYNPANGGNAELVEEIRALREEVRTLREQNNAGHLMGAQATHENTKRITKATEDSASQVAHTQRLQQRAVIA